MEKGIALFLEGLGFSMRSPGLRGIPRRVARAWQKEFLNGYSSEPEEILALTEREKGGKLVAVKGISFTSMCPHHLLPYKGVAHVAYIPNGKIVGFDRIVKLVDCFAHRLELQERVTTQIAASLMQGLGARGTACLLDSEHSCMTQRGVRREGSRVVTTSLLGEFETNTELSQAFFSSITKSPT